MRRLPSGTVTFLFTVIEGSTKLLHEKTLTSIHTQLDEAAFTEAWKQGRALTTDEAVALALDS